MPMSPTTAYDAITAFMVPTGPTGREDPPLGWPDGVTPAPAPIAVEVVEDPLNGEFRVAVDSGGAAIAPGAFLALPPFWEGSRIVAAAQAGARTILTLADPMSHPSGLLVEDWESPEYKPSLATLSQPYGRVLSIRRVFGSLDDFVAEDVANGSDPSSGKVGLSNAGVDAVDVGHILTFTMTRPYSAPATAGAQGQVLPPREEPPPGLTTGQAWAAAYRTLIAAGGANGVPVVPAALAGAEAAMRSVVDVMMPIPGFAALALSAGAGAFWGAMAASAPALFPGALTVLPPAGLVGLSGIVAAKGLLCAAVPIPDPWDPSASEFAAAQFSSALYEGSQGGLVVFSGPVAFPFI